MEKVRNVDNEIMTDDAISQFTISILSKTGYGILLPLIVFVAYQFVLIGSQDGTGSWDGMVIFFGTLFIAPGLLLLNC
jgi:hypothetical protein